MSLWIWGEVRTIEILLPNSYISDVKRKVNEASGRLHPLWPQNKWLHTPRSTDYRHNRQDRWIQTELAFTLAKNATKPNPFEIIPLQTTRNENNWKTEEALARAAVTLETERFKGSNPWCLWWWWWTSYLIRRYAVNIIFSTAVEFTFSFRYWFLSTKLRQRYKTRHFDSCIGRVKTGKQSVPVYWGVSLYHSWRCTVLITL